MWFLSHPHWSLEQDKSLLSLLLMSFNPGCTNPTKATDAPLCQKALFPLACKCRALSETSQLVSLLEDKFCYRPRGEIEKPTLQVSIWKTLMLWSISILTKESDKAVSTQQMQDGELPSPRALITENWFLFKKQLATGVRGRFTTWKMCWGAWERNKHHQTAVRIGKEWTSPCPELWWVLCCQRIVVVVTTTTTSTAMSLYWAWPLLLVGSALEITFTHLCIYCLTLEEEVQRLPFDRGRCRGSRKWTAICRDGAGTRVYLSSKGGF